MVRLAGFARMLEARGLGEWAVPPTDLLGTKEITQLRSATTALRGGTSRPPGVPNASYGRPTGDGLRQEQDPDDPLTIEPFKQSGTQLNLDPPTG